jgi:hypothetical protein
MTTLQRSLPSDLSETEVSGTISVFPKGKVTAEIFAICMRDLKKAKPKLDANWYDVLNRMIDVDGFTDERLIAATQSLIRNCPYPEPSHAEILNFDLRVKIYKAEEILEMCKDLSVESRKTFLGSYEAIEYHGSFRYANKEDVKKYSLPVWKSKSDRLKGLPFESKMQLIRNLNEEGRIDLVKEAAKEITSFVREITEEDIEKVCAKEKI